MYEVEFADRITNEYLSDVISESIHPQVDDKVQEHCMLEEIVYHQKDENAVEIDDMHATVHNGSRNVNKITKGWKRLV